MTFVFDMHASPGFQAQTAAFNRFIETVKLKLGDDLVRYVAPDESVMIEYGSLSDCFECTLNQRWHAELTCCEFKIDGVDIFAENQVEPCYVLMIKDFECDLTAGVYSHPEGPDSAQMLCFYGYENSKMVLRELVSLYAADGF